MQEYRKALNTRVLIIRVWYRSLYPDRQGVRLSNFLDDHSPAFPDDRYVTARRRYARGSAYNDESTQLRASCIATRSSSRGRNLNDPSTFRWRLPRQPSGKTTAGVRRSPSSDRLYRRTVLKNGNGTASRWTGERGRSACEQVHPRGTLASTRR